MLCLVCFKSICFKTGNSLYLTNHLDIPLSSLYEIKSKYIYLWILLTPQVLHTQFSCQTRVKLPQPDGEATANESPNRLIRVQPHQIRFVWLVE